MKPSYKWTLVAMLWCIVVLNYADRQALSGTLPLIGREFHLSLTEEGMLGAAFAWIYGLCSPFAGQLVDRIRRSTGVLGGLQIWSAICALTALAPGFRTLLVLRAGEGLGETAYFPASVAMISDYHEPRTRSRALALHQTGVYAGIVGGTTAAAAIGVRYGWRASFATFGLLGILLGVLLRYTLHDRDDAAERKAAPSLRAALKAMAAPAPACLVGAFICANGVASVLFVWLPTYLYDRFHQTLAVAGFSATLFAQAGSLAGAIAGGWLADASVGAAVLGRSPAGEGARRHTSNGRIVVQAAGLWLGVPFVLLSGFASSLPVTLAAFLGWGLAKGLYEANIFASMFDVTAAEIRGTVVGVMNMAGWLFGAGTAPIAVGCVAEHSSLGFAIASTAMIYVAGGILLMVAARFAGNGRLSVNIAPHQT